ncbi:uncharacterized protein LOC121530024 [Drosophila eugracilis]|uniref:uncharacterized protein LOC121530024 n=1 Tax=Drosophila eugracilis TaxID=29029 RepID=UPI001BDAAED6|nr:uncharacterized protein LOC121530024 [Drosophila eugracilis]
MGTRIKVMGTCPYCRRHVSRDLRPINMLSARDAKKISQLLNEQPPPVQLDSGEEMGKVDDHGRRNVRVSKRKKETEVKSELQSNLEGSCSQSKLQNPKCSIVWVNGKNKATENFGSEEKDTRCGELSVTTKIESESGEETVELCSQKSLEDCSIQEKIMENPKEIAQDGNSANSLDAITENIVGLVEEEFNRDPASCVSSGILKGNAEVIMAMLTEEQHIIDQIEKQASKTKMPPAKSSRR